MKIVLMGYMASGKSAVGKILAEKLALQFIDLDCFIEENEKMTIADIFKAKGEIYFRKQESFYLKEVLQLPQNLIISLGGGTPCYGNNSAVIQNNSVSFYLKASISNIYNRLKNETEKRPLVATIGLENLQEYIAKHLFERAPFYEQATHSVLVNSKSVEEIATEIKELL